MLPHSKRELIKLTDLFLSLGATVEEQFQKVSRSLIEMDFELAQEISGSDEKIDELEVEIEEECLKYLALYSPVASDLRYVVSILKINNDLERIGDLTTNIAKGVAHMRSNPRRDFGMDFEPMLTTVTDMLHNTLDAVSDFNCKLAHSIIQEDERVDAFKRELKAMALEKMVLFPERVSDLSKLIAIASHLERIADHATNVAEDVIYMKEGDIIRHTHALPDIE